MKIVEQKDSVTVYLIALYAQYQGSEGRIDLTGAVCSPVSIVFSKDEHQYVLDEYWVPEDGEGYEQSLREKFPSDIIECALELELPDGMETCDQKAKDYFGVPQDEGHEDGGALGGQRPQGFYPSQAVGQDGVQAVLLLVAQSGKLAEVFPAYG